MFWRKFLSCVLELPHDGWFLDSDLQVAIHNYTPLKVSVVEMDNASLFLPVNPLASYMTYLKLTHALVLITSFSSVISVNLPWSLSLMSFTLENLQLIQHSINQYKKTHPLLLQLF